MVRRLKICGEFGIWVGLDDWAGIGVKERKSERGLIQGLRFGKAAEFFRGEHPV
jgi:hypothetical protein